MLKSFINRIAFSSLAAVMAFCQPAFAQLNIGRYGVQSGLEQNFLRYQLSGEPLSGLQVIPACDVGFGVSCNKTGIVLQQLLDSNSRTNQYDLLLRAAGGEQNYRNFAAFYGNNPNLPVIPYSSFWRNDASNYIDGHQYLLGQLAGREPVAGLGQVTRNFHWAPLTGEGDALSLRSGLLNLKYSYGRLLLEEVSKIPNLTEQIQALGLPKDETQYYTENFSRGFQALKTGNENQLQFSIQNLLSAPFSPTGGQLGRPLAGVPDSFNLVYGEGLEGTTVAGIPPVTLEPETLALDVPGGGEEIFLTPRGDDNDFPAWLLGFPIAGLLLFLAFSGGDSDDDSGGRRRIVSSGGEMPDVTPPQPGPTLPPTPSPGPSVGPGPGAAPTPTPTVSPNPTPTITPGQEMKKVPEPSALSAVIVLALVFSLLNRRKRRFS